MTPLERVEGAGAALKVLPLPSVVLFPGMMLPLHIFEERYRELLKDCLQSDKVIALAQLEPGWEGKYAERPALRPIGCAGLVTWHQAFRDGRYNVIVHGAVRVRVMEELPPRKLYREVRAEVIPDPVEEAPEEEPLRQAVLELSGRLPQPFGASLLQSAARTRGGGLADAVAAIVVADLDRRQQLLDELNVRRRLGNVLNEVGDLIGRLGLAKPAGPVN
jgi:Lon protease-like protein